MQLRDAAGNESTTRTGTITLDQTPPDPPALQLADLNNDGYAVTANTIELSWTQPSASNYYELQRYVFGVDADFATIQGSLPAATIQYTDSTDKPGIAHQYRIRARDDLGNTSSWSLVVVARPYMPVTESVWIKSEDRYKVLFSPQTGVFQLDSAYEWIDADAASYSSVLGTNVVEWLRPDVSDFRLNEAVAIRQRNADNSLLYDTRVPLPFNSMTDIGVINAFSGAPAALVLPDQMNPTVFFLKNQLPLTIRKIEMVNGAPVEEQLGTENPLGLDAAVDPLGNSIVAYRPTGASQPLKIVSKVVLSDSFEHSRSTGNWPVVGGTSVISTGAVNEPFGSSSLLLSGAGAFIQSFSLAAFGELQFRYFWQPGGPNNAGGTPESNDYLRFQYTTDGSTWINLTQHGGLDAKDTEFVEVTGTVPASAIAVRFINNGTIAADQYFIDGVELKSAGWVLQTALSSTDNIGNRPKVAIDGDGIPHIVHRDSTNLRLLWTRRVAGAWSTSEIDVTGNNGETFDFLIDPAGKLHVAYYDDDTNKQVKYATNASGIWAFDVVEFHNTNYPGLRGVGIARDSTGLLHIVYAAQNGWLGLRWSAGSKGSWSAATQITTKDPHQNTKIVAVAADRHPRVLFKQDGVLDPVLMTYNGTSWSAVNLYVPGDGGWGMDLAIDRLGNSHTTFGNITRAQQAYMRIGPDSTPHWSSGTFGTGGSTADGRGVDVAIDRFGRRHMVYYNAGGTRYVKPDGTEESIGISGSQMLALAVDHNGFAHVAMLHNLALHYLHNKTGAWQDFILDSSAAYTGLSPDIAVDLAGVAHISYVNYTDDRAMYINSAAGTPVIVSYDGEPFGKTSIAVDRQGFVHMTYGKSVPARLGYAHNKSGTMTEQVLPGGFAIATRNTSLVLDKNDRPHVLAFTWQQSDVYYAVLDDGTWSAQWVERTPEVGKALALALDSTGRPHAAYKDKGDGLTRLAVLQDDGTWLHSTLLAGCDGSEEHGVAIVADHWDVMTTACHITTGGVKWATGRFFGKITGISSTLPEPF